MGTRIGVLGIVAVVAALALAGTASAAQLIDRDAVGLRLSVNSKGEALLTYRKGGATKHVLVWGAINALPPTAGAKQAAFHAKPTREATMRPTTPKRSSIAWRISVTVAVTIAHGSRRCSREFATCSALDTVELPPWRRVSAPATSPARK